MPRRLLYEEHLPAYQEGFRHRNRNQVVHETGSANPLYADSVARAPGEYGSLKSYTEGFRSVSGKRFGYINFKNPLTYVILISVIIMLYFGKKYMFKGSLSKPKYYYF